MQTDANGRVLDHDGVQVDGLWVAGGLSNWTYARGLAFNTGRRAAFSALAPEAR